MLKVEMGHRYLVSGNSYGLQSETLAGGRCTTFMFAQGL